MFDATTLFSTWPMWLVVILGVWSLVWKGISLWKCGRHNQMAWFIVILIFNTLGILPIIYLLFFQKKERKVLNVVRVKKAKRKPVKRRVKKKVTKKKVKKKTTKRKTKKRKR